MTEVSRHMIRALNALDTGFEQVTPREAPHLMQGYEEAWWIAGGWALDLVGGAITRDHIDLDIGVFREDLSHLFEALSDVELHSASDGRLELLSGPREMRPEANSIWAKRPDAEKWLFELIMNEREKDEWVYRREPSIRRPLNGLTVEVDGLKCLRPEIQLLFKAKHMRGRDIADFDAHSPTLNEANRVWLRDALAIAHPGHTWIGRLT